MFRRNGLFQRLWHGAVLITWAAWWGGLSFYAIVVVPIGTEALGSAQQGFITQQVTFWHNCIFALFIGLLIGEAAYRPARLLWAAIATLAIVNIALFIQHAYLTKQMDFHEQTVPAAFYRQHATYLWITTVEWLIGLGMPFLLHASSQGTRGNSQEEI